VERLINGNRNAHLEKLCHDRGKHIMFLIYMFKEKEKEKDNLLERQRKDAVGWEIRVNFGVKMRHWHQKAMN